MASRSSEFLTTDVIEIEDDHKDATEIELSLARNMEADLLLMLMADDKDEEKIPLFHFKEGNA